MGEDQDLEIWNRLSQGKPLDGLVLPTFEGRIDLRGLAAPDPSLGPVRHVASASVQELSGLTVLRGVHWKGIDASGCRLNSLRFFDSIIEDCVFDEGSCQDWRMWGTRVSDTGFRGTDLRGSALGGVDNGKRNSFRRVDFTRADLRKSAHVSAEMIGCDFADTKLAKVDFQGTVFENCRFAGKLREVSFYRHAFRGEGFPPNEMRGVDFREAKFHYVEFRGLDMPDVRWPEDPDHVVLKGYVPALDRMLGYLEGRTDLPSRQAAAVLGMKRKWAGPNQVSGILNVAELSGFGSEELVSELLKLAV